MLWDDIIYVSLLLLCVTFGPFYRKIEDRWTKKWVGTLVGVSLVVFVSGVHTLHPIIFTVVNALIITKLSWKICHLASFFFSFFYLLIIFRLGEYFGLSEPLTHANLIQMILTLKLPGLAFEKNSAGTTAIDTADNHDGLYKHALKKLDFLEVFHYSFSYIGVLTGPYYSYRTYWDSIHRPFAKYVDPWPITYHKLKQTGVFSALFLFMNYTFPGKYAVSDEFAQRSFFYRFFYMYPAFATFRFRMYSGMALSECVCQTAGIGAYPTSSDITPGAGPKNYKLVENLSIDLETLNKEKLDFETVHNMKIFEVEMCHEVRVAMKTWNTCIQYWMATCVYKRFPIKPLRTVATLTLSALWHGYAAGYYFCICQVPLYLPLETVYVKFYKNCPENSIAKTACRLFLWYGKTTCMAYLGIPFLLLDYHEIIQFYKNLYFSGHILGVMVYIIGRCLKTYFPGKASSS